MAGVDEVSYLINRALRLRAATPTYLSRNSWSSPNRQLWTWSGWVKRCSLGTEHSLTGAYDGGSTYASRLLFTTGDVLAFDFGGAALNQVATTAVFRDVTAWYHVVLIIDTGNAVGADRCQIWVNGVRQTVTGVTIPQFTNTQFWIHGTNNYIGYRYLDAFDGYFAEVHCVNGQALSPSNFGEVRLSTGVWYPKRYTGTYGTNGFYLPFTDTTSTTSLCYDASGNNNNFTPTNISLTAGETYDSVVDTPTNNHCTMSVLANAGAQAIYWGGMRIDTQISTGDKWVFGSYTIPTSGKWYWEVKVASGGDVNGRAYFGLADAIHEQVGASNPSIGVGFGQTNCPVIATGGTVNTATLGTLAANDVVCFAYDADNNQVFLSKNANINTGATAAITALGVPSAYGFRPGVYEPSGIAGRTLYINYGQQPFVYTKPAGYRKLCANDLSEPYVKKPTKFFDVRTYTGNGTSPRAIISDLSFGPDITWVKRRNIANTSHALTARFAGAGNVVLSPDTNLGFVGTNGAMTSWDNNGVTVQTGSTDFAFYNTNASNYVAYNWYSGYWIDHNYVKNSEAMDASSWVKTLTTTVTPNTTVAPDGTTTADTINQGITNGGGIYQDFGFSPGNQPYCFSVYLKSTTSNQLTVVIYWLNSVVEAMQMSFNPLTGAYLNSWVVSGSPTNLGYSITDVGGGWYRVALYGTGATPANTFARPTVYNNGGSGTDYQMWGAMCNYGLGVGDYFPTGNSPAFRHKYPATGTGVSYYDHTNGTATATYHGLGVSPDFVFLKNRSTTGDWMVFHKDMGGTMGDTYMRFNFVNQSTTGGGCTVDASKVTVGSGYATATGHIHTFKSIDGFSKFGKYTGNGSANGPFVNCGFRPALVMIKRVDASGFWYLFDNKRDPDNVVDVELYANSTSVEATAAHLVDFTANGFKIRSGAAWTEGNASGGTYIFAAWAEAPFKYALAR